ncbi:hypothetical protein [Cohnella abietis]|uniref:Uncharacterized protein n=1 Tax=Cohnella abietis TaxID=2507935 RepID=A0A3T1D2K7_9BACL|nr:hypothetical protein [Cohnella abietis]BBI32343.1 hypothetical protein KCTCHS21_17420 [Cohnella abietis]
MSTIPEGQTVERFVPDKKEFLLQIAAGKSVSKIERMWNMNPGSLHYWVGKWEWKGIKPDRAQQLLDEMAIDGEAPVSKPGLLALNELNKQEAEITELNSRLQLALERIETLTETTNNALDRNTALIQERDDYKQAAMDLESKIDTQSDQQAEIERLRTELEELESDRQILLATIDLASAASILEENVPVPKLAGRSIHTEIDAPTEQIVDELAALISYIRSGNGERFLLDLQLNEVTA